MCAAHMQPLTHMHGNRACTPARAGTHQKPTVSAKDVVHVMANRMAKMESHFL